MWKIIIIIIIGLIWFNYDIIIKKLNPKEELNDDIFIQSNDVNIENYVITETSNEIIDNVLKKIEF